MPISFSFGNRLAKNRFCATITVARRLPPVKVIRIAEN